jgi:hypothetical protein
MHWRARSSRNHRLRAHGRLKVYTLVITYAAHSEHRAHLRRSHAAHHGHDRDRGRLCRAPEQIQRARRPISGRRR